MAITLRLKCDGCGTSMRGRDGERTIDLRNRARRAGWKDSWDVDYKDLCQVCASKKVS